TPANKDLAEGHAFLYHLADGTAPSLIKDYDGLRDHNCLQPKFIGIHSTALGSDQFKEWHAKAKGGAIVWSPFSNLWLYGKTTDVVAAGKAGLIVCLGADWSPSGSKSVLGELKVADLHNKLTLGGALSDRDICAMVTCNPARALGWENLLGQLKAGLHADFVVMAAKGKDKAKDPYRTLIESVEADVLLVAINGYPIYGTAHLMTAASAVNPEPIQVNATLKRRITLRDDRIPDADVSWTDVIGRLEAARQDPAVARTQALKLDQVTEPSVALIPDKAWDDPAVHPELLEQAAAATIPPLDPLTPDEAFFAALSTRIADMGDSSQLRVLDALHSYYGL
ncbi:MAG: amidohydrolase family protein, partial [Solirubrobacteraceae bacterium]